MATTEEFVGKVMGDTVGLRTPSSRELGTSWAFGRTSPSGGPRRVATWLVGRGSRSGRCESGSTP